MKVTAKRTYTATNGAQENKGDARTGRCDGTWRSAKLFMTGLCYDRRLLCGRFFKTGLFLWASIDSGFSGKGVIDYVG